MDSGADLPVVIVVAGPPASGKTTLARHLADSLHLPLFYKDLYKEILFDILGTRDRAWSRRLGAAALAMLYACVEAELRAGRSLISESNFKADMDGPRWQSLQLAHPFRCLQIQCRADGDVLQQRFLDREIGGGRHPGHAGLDHLDELREVLRSGRHDPLPLDCDLIWFDTTDLTTVDFSPLLERARDLLAGNPLR